MEIVRSCIGNKVYDYLNNKKSSKIKKNACIVFNHGLGDYILFLPIFNKLQNIFEDNWNLFIGSSPEKGFKCLHKDSVYIYPPYGKYELYDVIFNINYLEPPREEIGFFNEKLLEGTSKTMEDIKNISKPELCNLIEIGIPDFEWDWFKIVSRKNSIKGRIGVHFFGYAWSQDKNTDLEVAEEIWNEIIQSGFNPIEIQMIPPFKLGIIEHPKWITRENSIRYNFPNLKIMIQEIIKCDLFIGVDSGPLYLANSILGSLNCIALEKNRKIEKVFPKILNELPFDVININNYISGSISKKLENIYGVKNI